MEKQPTDFSDRVPKTAIKSKSIRGNLLSIAGILATIVITYAETETVPPELLVAALPVLSGNVVAIWGRYQAVRPIEGVL